MADGPFPESLALAGGLLPCFDGTGLFARTPIIGWRSSASVTLFCQLAVAPGTSQALDAVFYLHRTGSLHNIERLVSNAMRHIKWAHFLRENLTLGRQNATLVAADQLFCWTITIPSTWSGPLKHAINALNRH